MTSGCWGIVGSGCDGGGDVVRAGLVGGGGFECGELPVTPSRLTVNVSYGGAPKRFLADAGYWPDGNNQQLVDAQVDGSIATGRLKHGQSSPLAPRGRIPNGASPKQHMARKLRTKTGRAVYAKFRSPPAAALPDTGSGLIARLRALGQALTPALVAARAETSPPANDLTCSALAVADPRS